MKAFEVVVIARSDGSDTGPGYWPATAPAKQPATAADPTPKPKPQMVRLSEDDPRFVEWRVKLGMLLKQEFGPESDGKFPLDRKDCSVTNLRCRRQRLVRRVPPRILAIREVKTSLGFGLPR